MKLPVKLITSCFSYWCFAIVIFYISQMLCLIIHLLSYCYQRKPFTSTRLWFSIKVFFSFPRVLQCQTKENVIYRSIKNVLHKKYLIFVQCIFDPVKLKQAQYKFPKDSSDLSENSVIRHWKNEEIGNIYWFNRTKDIWKIGFHFVYV